MAEGAACRDIRSPCIHCKNGVCREILKGYFEERTVEIVDYIIENNTIVRQTAKRFRISKSKVHIEVIILNSLCG